MKCSKCNNPLSYYFEDDNNIFHCSKCGHRTIIPDNED